MTTISLIETIKIQQKIYAAKFVEHEKLSDFELTSCLKGMTDSDIARMVGCMTDSDIARMVGCMSDSDIARMVGCMTDSDIARMVGCMTGSDIASMVGRMSDSDIALLNIKIPIVDDLDKEVFASVGDGARKLNMHTWHNDCGTLHCWAGWIVTIAGATELEERFGNTALVATWIYEASTGKIAPDFYNTSNEEAYTEMKKRAGVL
jgi:hypothetical protein